MKCSGKITIWQTLHIGLLTLIALLLASEQGVMAQQIEVNAQIDTSRALIGDQVRITLNAKHDKNSAISWPLLGDTLTSSIEVVSLGIRDTLEDGDDLSHTQEILITSFDSGYFVIPPFVFTIEGDTSTVFETEALLIQVSSVPVDTSQAIKDIKEPMGAPITLAEAWPYLVGGILLIALVVLGIIYWKKKKKVSAPAVFKKPATPSYETALSKLKELEDKKLWQKDKVKDYHTELTDIIREYIENRYGIIALELTSDEILLSYSGLELDSTSTGLLSQILNLADMVKFAKAKPLANEHSLSMANSYAFVRVGISELERNITEPAELDKEESQI